MSINMNISTDFGDLKIYAQNGYDGISFRVVEGDSYEGIEGIEGSEKDLSVVRTFAEELLQLVDIVEAQRVDHT